MMIKKQRPIFLLVALLAINGQVAYSALPALNAALAQSEAAVKTVCTQYPDFCAKPGQRARILAKYPNIFDVVRTVTTPGGGGTGPALAPTQGIVDVQQAMQDALGSGDVQKVATTFNLFSNQKLTGNAFSTLQNFKIQILTLFGGTFSPGVNGLDQYTPLGGTLPPPPPPVPTPPAPPIPGGPPPAPPGLPLPVAKTWASELTALREGKGGYEETKKSLEVALPKLPPEVQLALFASWTKSKAILEFLNPLIDSNPAGYPQTAALKAVIAQYITAFGTAYNNREKPDATTFDFDFPVPNSDPSLPPTTQLGTMLTAWIQEFLKVPVKNTPKYALIIELQKGVTAFCSYIPTILTTYKNYAGYKAGAVSTLLDNLKNTEETAFINAYDDVVSKLQQKIRDLRSQTPALIQVPFFTALDAYEKTLTGTTSPVKKSLAAYKKQVADIVGRINKVSFKQSYGSAEKDTSFDSILMYLADFPAAYAVARGVLNTNTVCVLKALEGKSQAKETPLSYVIDQDPTTGLFGPNSTILYDRPQSPFIVELKADLSLPLVLPKESSGTKNAVIGILRVDYDAPPDPTIFDLGPWAPYAPNDLKSEAIMNSTGGYDVYLWAPNLAEAPATDPDASFINLRRLYVASAQELETSLQRTELIRFNTQCIRKPGAPVVTPPTPPPSAGAAGGPTPPPPPPAPGLMIPLPNPLLTNTCLYKIYSYNSSNFGSKQFQFLEYAGTKKVSYPFSYLDKQYMTLLKKLEKTLGYLGPKPITP